MEFKINIPNLTFSAFIISTLYYFLKQYIDSKFDKSNAMLSAKLDQIRDKNKIVAENKIKTYRSSLYHAYSIRNMLRDLLNSYSSMNNTKVKSKLNILTKYSNFNESKHELTKHLENNRADFEDDLFKYLHKLKKEVNKFELIAESIEEETDDWKFLYSVEHLQKSYEEIDNLYFNISDNVQRYLLAE